MWRLRLAGTELDALRRLRRALKDDALGAAMAREGTCSDGARTQVEVCGTSQNWNQESVERSMDGISSMDGKVDGVVNIILSRVHGGF